MFHMCGEPSFCQKVLMWDTSSSQSISLSPLRGGVLNYHVRVVDKNIEIVMFQKRNGAFYCHRLIHDLCNSHVHVHLM